MLSHLQENIMSKENYTKNRFNPETETPEEKEEQARADRLTAAVDLFQVCSEQWRDIRTKAESDLEFYSGQQWDAALIAAGQVKKEPVISVNRLPQFVKQIENELRSREITITVSPTDESGSDDTADIYNGLIRHIQDDSNAQVHYIHAAGENGALVAGFGFLRVDIEPLSKNSWSNMKKLKISSVFDPFTVLPDFSSESADFSDANYWFEISDWSLDDYRIEFPRSQANTLDITSTGVNQDSWGMNQNSLNKDIRVLRYWYKEQISAVQYKLADGRVIDTTVYEKPAVDAQEADKDMTGRMPFPTTKGGSEEIFSRKREVMVTKIKWMDMNGTEILREGDWPGEHFPFVGIIGPQTVVNGRRDIRGIIRYAKDPQKMLNYMASSIARRIGSANKAPWVADKRSIAPYQKQWQTANTENWSVLLWDAFRDNPAQAGELLPNPPPQRADQTGQIMDLLQASQHWSDELQATIGIYDSGLGKGQTANEQSGIAIQTLAQQGNTSNLHFSDNLVMSMQHLGEVLIDLIPRIYSEARTVKIVNPDSSEEVVKINQIFNMNGVQKRYDLGIGEYSVKVNAGPAFATKKQAALNQILELTRIDPQLVPVLQDIMVSAMDFPGSKVVQDRLQKLFAANFPQLVDTSKGLPPLPPQAQAEMEQANQMIQQLTKELQTIQAEYEKAEMLIKTDTLKAENQVKIDNNQARIEMELEKLRMKKDEENNNAKIMMEMIKDKIEHIENMHKILLPHLMAEQTKNMPHREDGGPVEAGQPTVVGEDGPEVIVPDQNGTVIPNPNTPAPAPIELSPLEKLEQYAKMLRDTSDGKKSDMEIADKESE